MTAVTTFGIAAGFIGLISGGLSIYNFASDKFAQAEPRKAVVRIGVGLDVDDGLNKAGGSLPDVRLFNEAGHYIGIDVDPGYVSSGSYGDIKVRLGRRFPLRKNTEQQPTYTLFSANDDSICIAYVSITWPSGDKYAFDGDWGRACGGSWYFSNYYVSATKKKPSCMWIDANDEEGIQETGFQVHWPDYVPSPDGIPSDPREREVMKSRLSYSGPPFKYYFGRDPNEIIHRVPDGSHKRKKKPHCCKQTTIMPAWSKTLKQSESSGFLQNQHHHQNSSTRQRIKHFDRLVIDDNLERAPHELCASPMSFGPDFANIADGTFCRMLDKTLWPICNENIFSDCLDIDARNLIINEKVGKRSPDSNDKVARRSPYKNVIYWRKESTS